MKTLNLGVAALNQTPLDWKGNTERIKKVIAEARIQKVGLLVLPELCISGYGCEDALGLTQTASMSLHCLESILPYTQNLVLNLGMIFEWQKHLYNCNVLVGHQRILGIVPKRVLANDGVYYEARWFKPWPFERVEELTLNLNGNKQTFPMGDIAFKWNQLVFGYEVCEEAWTTPRVGQGLFRRQAHLMINPSASHFAFKKNEKRKDLVLKGSKDFNCLYAYSNLVGNESGRLIFDGGLFIAEKGTMVAESKRFTFKKSLLITHPINLDQLSESDNYSYSGDSKKSIPAPHLVSIEFEIPKGTDPNPTTPNPTIVSGSELLRPLSLNQEFEAAVSLGLFDYLRKSRSHGFVISLSGGVDSAVVATLAVESIKSAFSSLGADEFYGQLEYIPMMAHRPTLPELIKSLIFCVYQESSNSSQTTFHSARTLSQELGVSFLNWSIEPMRALYQKQIESALGRTLNWNEDDLALQNIQARVRAPGVWLLANVKRALLLATCNRSEAAVGYATMDGDTAGGLSPLAGVDKAFLNQWIRWKSSAEFKSETTIYRSLQEIFKIPPAAELRPPGQNQTDETDLMPYPVLTALERELILNRRSPREALHRLLADFSDYSQPQMLKWVQLFLRLWKQNQWKRERFAPSFHLDEFSLDPKTWWRYPILSEGFADDTDVERPETQ